MFFVQSLQVKFEHAPGHLVNCCYKRVYINLILLAKYKLQAQIAKLHVLAFHLKMQCFASGSRLADAPFSCATLIPIPQPKRCKREGCILLYIRRIKKLIKEFLEILAVADQHLEQRFQTMSHREFHDLVAILQCE